MDSQMRDHAVSADGVTVVRLADCIQFMQADLVHANPTPENLAHEVTDVLMYDPLDEWTNVDNRIILAVGFSYGSADFDQLLHRASNSNAAAVIVKAHGAHIEQLRDAAVRHELAVLVAPGNADWTRLVSLARASVVGASADSVSGVRLGDLYAFANAVASMTNGAASIVDPLGRILGYSTLPGQPIDELRRVTTLALQESGAPAFDADFKAIYAAAEALYIPSTKEGVARLALAVRAGGELLGSIWIVDPGEGRQQAALDALNQMASLAGLHMLHARSASDFGERRNGDLIRTLIDDPEHASFAAAQLGLDVNQGLAVVGLTIAQPDSGSLDAVREIQRLLHLVTTVCNVRFTTSHSALIGSVVYALFPCQGEDPRATHRRILEEIATYGHSITSHPLVAAAGSVARRIHDLPESRESASKTLQYLLGQLSSAVRARAELPLSVALFEDHRIPLNLLRVGEFLGEQGLADSDQLAVLHAYDANNQTAYVETLRAYLGTNGSISTMAKTLNVHNNTVRYRITQLAKIFGVDLDDPQKRLWLWLRLITEDLGTRMNREAGPGSGRR